MIEPRFVSYSVGTKDGRSLTGIVIGETSTSLTLAQSGGVQERILRSDIAEMRASALSLMPEGLENALPPQELADLLAYLKAGPARVGSATEEQAAQARAQLLAEGANGLGKFCSVPRGCRIRVGSACCQCRIAARPMDSPKLFGRLFRLLRMFIPQRLTNSACRQAWDIFLNLRERFI